MIKPHPLECEGPRLSEQIKPITDAALRKEFMRFRDHVASIKIKAGTIQTSLTIALMRADEALATPAQTDPRDALIAELVFTYESLDGGFENHSDYNVMRNRKDKAIDKARAYLSQKGV